jgi:hypothetical protein
MPGPGPMPPGPEDAILTVTFDANIIYPMALCDYLLWAAQRSVFRPGWSRSILDEAERNLVAKGVPNAPRRMQRMREAFEDADPESMPSWACGRPKRRTADACDASMAVVLAFVAARGFKGPARRLEPRDVAPERRTPGAPGEGAPVGRPRCQLPWRIGRSFESTIPTCASTTPSSGPTWPASRRARRRTRGRRGGEAAGQLLRGQAVLDAIADEHSGTYAARGFSDLRAGFVLRDESSRGRRSRASQGVRPRRS